jgi:hypothetical protein
MKKHREVNQKEFLIFVDNKNLETHVCRIVEPIQVQFNNFSSGKIWPESVVAYFYDDYLEDNKRRYFIIERESKSC